jgi:soluble lytic murein transglycosylase-like protein
MRAVIAWWRSWSPPSIHRTSAQHRSQDISKPGKLVAVLAFAASLHAGKVDAQTAALLEFRSDVATGSGAAIERADDFTLVTSGQWARTVERLALAGAESADRGHALPNAEDCAVDGLPPAIPGLSAAIARRRLLFWHIVAHHECRNHLPPGLLDAVILQESRYTPDAVSRAGAQGLAQLMPGTAAALGVDDVFDPDRNIDGGARYLGAMLARFGSVPLGLAAYNAGPGRVSAVGGIPDNRETPGYVRRVMGYWNAGTRDTLGSARATAAALGFNAPGRD